MKNRSLAQLLLLIGLAIGASAQDSLIFFTNYANYLLQCEFGISVTNIPIYSMTDTSVGYTAALHYQLQAAADAYDDISPATDPPSVFRPQFSWQGGTLCIVGYAQVTNNFDMQTASGFKDLSDPTITTDDNVWGIPWVIGTKPGIPAFNEYCYGSEMTVSRQLTFERLRMPNGQYAVTQPPIFTNQYYSFSISNAFGLEAWNFWNSPLTNTVSILFSNQISISVTNGYDFGTNLNLFAFVSNTISSVPGTTASWLPNSFMTPFLTNFVAISNSYWSESVRQLIPLIATNTHLSSDSNQVSWPVYRWTVSVTNRLFYALIDTESGNALDYVNLGPFGSSCDITGGLNIGSPSSMWTIAPATDLSNSPMSSGAINQIVAGMQMSPAFAFSLLGIAPGGFPSTIGAFSDPYTASAGIIQKCSWSAANPRVHYVMQDLTGFLPNQSTTVFSPVTAGQPITLSNSVCTLGATNYNYNSGNVRNFAYTVADNLFDLSFSGASDLPYEIWTSTDLTDWELLGAASQVQLGQFQFQDSFSPYDTARFYQVQAP